ncbi:Glucose-6-phosphate 1-dehydrogenase, partial [Durusdinium trenchii]
MLRWSVLWAASAWTEELSGSCRAGQLLEDPKVWNGSVDGLDCHATFGERCCPEAPAQQVLAWMQLASDHNKQQLASLEVAVSNAMEMKSLMDSQCQEPQEVLLMSRAGALKAMVEHAQDMLGIIVHLLISGLCRFCYQMDQESLDALQEKGAIDALAAMLLKFQRLQEEILKGDRSVARIDPQRRCIPHYLVELLSGTAVGDTSQLQSAVQRITTWPLSRRLSAKKPQESEAHRLAPDFYEFGERLFGTILAAPARVGHQLNILCLSLEKRNHWSMDQPTARILWGLEDGFQGLGVEEVHGFVANDAPSSEQSSNRQANESYSAPDPDSAFGLVVLVSNQTKGSTISELMQRFEGPRCLFLEDTCGSTLDALGYNCHSNSEEQRSCLHPSHVTNMVRNAEEAWSPNLQPHVAWRRHAGTRGIVQSAGELGSSLWGPKASIWLMDFRPEAKCVNQRPLKQQLEVHHRINLVKKPELLLDMSSQTVLSAPGSTEAPQKWPEDTPL